MTASTAPVQSRFDTTIGCLHLDVEPAASTREAWRDAYRRHGESPQKGREYLEAVVEMVWSQHYTLIAHESAHVLQAITHPAVYLRCLRELSAVGGLIDELMRSPADIPLPLEVAERWVAELSISTHPARIQIGDDGLPSLEAASPMHLRPNDVSEADLLEDSASIFEYKAEIDGEGSAEGYRRWLDEAGEAPGAFRYSKTFDLLSEVLSPADAYASLPALVMGACTTNWPLATFTGLLSMTVREAPAPPSEMGVDAYWDFLEGGLSGSLPVAVPDPRRSLFEQTDRIRMDRAAMLALAADGWRHPLTPLVKLAWKDEESIRRLRLAMLHPALAFDRDRRQVREWFEPFEPPVMVFRLLGEGIQGGDVVFRVSEALSAVESPLGVSWPQSMLELMRMKTFVFAAATPFSRGPHSCPHRDCEFHRYEMCRDWLDIPTRPQECSFPEWLRTRAGRKLDSESAMLLPVTDEESGR